MRSLSELPFFWARQCFDYSKEAYLFYANLTDDVSPIYPIFESEEEFMKRLEDAGIFSEDEEKGIRPIVQTHCEILINSTKKYYLRCADYYTKKNSEIEDEYVRKVLKYKKKKIFSWNLTKFREKEWVPPAVFAPGLNQIESSYKELSDRIREIEQSVDSGILDEKYDSSKISPMLENMVTEFQQTLKEIEDYSKIPLKYILEVTQYRANNAFLIYAKLGVFIAGASLALLLLIEFILDKST